MKSTTTTTSLLVVAQLALHVDKSLSAPVASVSTQEQIGVKSPNNPIQVFPSNIDNGSDRDEPWSKRGVKPPSGTKELVKQLSKPKIARTGESSTHNGGFKQRPSAPEDRLNFLREAKAKNAIIAKENGASSHLNQERTKAVHIDNMKMDYAKEMQGHKGKAFGQRLGAGDVNYFLKGGN